MIGFGINNDFEYYIIDLDSETGTYINNVRIPLLEWVILKDKNYLTFGGGTHITRGDYCSHTLNPCYEFQFRYIVKNGLAYQKQKKTLSGLLRCIPKLLKWRKTATEAVFHPKRIKFTIVNNEPGELEFK